MPLFSGGNSEITYTPSIVSGITLSTGTVNGRYIRIGNLVSYTIIYVFGTGDTFTGSGTPFMFTLPLLAATGMQPSQAQAFIEDTGAGAFNCVIGPGQSATSNTPSIWQAGVLTTPNPDAPGITNWSTTQPFTWVAGDRVVHSGWYIAA